MKYITNILITLALMLQLFACSNNNKNNNVPVAKKGVIDLRQWDFHQNGTLHLDGEWEFYWKQLINPQQFIEKKIKPLNYANIPSYWHTVSIDSLMLPSIGYATYRLTVLSDKKQKLAMFIDKEMTAYNLWCDTLLLHSAGTVATNYNEGEPNRRPVILELNLVKDTTEFVLQISNFHHRKGGFYVSPLVGTSEHIHLNKDQQRAYDIFLFGSLTIIGLYYIVLYFFGSSLPGTLSFGIFSILLAIRTLLTGTRFITIIFPSMSWVLQYRLEYFSLFVAPVLMANFLYRLYKKDINIRLIQIYLLISVLFSLTLFLPPYIFTRFLYGELLLFVPGAIYLLWRLFIAFKNKREGAGTIIASLLLYFVTIINDIFYIRGDISWSIELIPLGTFILVLGQILALIKIFAQSFYDNQTLTNEIEYKNANLDSIVRERTKKVRMQQDAMVEQNEELKQQNQKITKISTDLEKQKQQLVLSETKMRSLVQLLPEAIFELDWDGNIVYANYEFYANVRAKRDKILNISDFIVNTDANDTTFVEKIGQQIKNQNMVKEWSLQMQRTDNSKFPALFSIALVPENKDVAYRCMFMDITSRITDENIINKAYKELRLKNKDITDSLKYALTMQKAVMPTNNQIDEILKKYFIINKPHSIVSGDFYYITKIKNKIIFTLSDCTGHGVPGGFMTMLGITLLNELYGGTEVPSPDYALGRMRAKIIENLDQHDDDMSNKDGMEMILCILDTNTLTLEFASANQPLFILRNDEITTIKGDRMPISIYTKMKEFALKQVQLQKGDRLYVFSDGIVDTFGGKNGRKLYLRGLRSMIESCIDEPMHKQGEIIENQFLDWQGEYKQIDDVLVIGWEIDY